jgi:hypothetical protein
VRELLSERPEARGRKLLEVPGYTFHVLVTTLSLDPVQTWHFYNSRAESENRLKELKEDFALSANERQRKVALNRSRCGQIMRELGPVVRL